MGNYFRDRHKWKYKRKRMKKGQAKKLAELQREVFGIPKHERTREGTVEEVDKDTEEGQGSDT
jgi:hypothetical protein